MHNLVEVVGLTPLLEKHGITYKNRNFEELYQSLHIEEKHGDLCDEIEDKLIKYFSSLVIPDDITIYDKLLLSLKHDDMIATFNWDPFLIQAYNRNQHIDQLPQIAFLHGNVALGLCYSCSTNGVFGENCPGCEMPFSRSKLLFPIAEKDYKTDPFIHYEWKCFENMLDKSMMVTIFGYGVPTTDVNAKEKVKKSFNRS